MGCNPLSHFDAGQCASGLLGSGFDLLTGWVWGLPIWVLIVAALVILGFAYRQAGISGLTAAAVGIGVLIGRRSKPVAAKGQGGDYYLTIDQMKDVQRALAARHLYPGKIDGVLGKQSQDGIRALQRRIGPPEPVNGTLTPGVRKALGLNF